MYLFPHWGFISIKKKKSLLDPTQQCSYLLDSPTISIWGLQTSQESHDFFFQKFKTKVEGCIHDFVYLGFFFCFVLFCFWAVLEGNSWLCIEKSLLAGSGDHRRCWGSNLGLSQVAHVQGKRCVISRAPVSGVLIGRLNLELTESNALSGQ